VLHLPLEQVFELVELLAPERGVNTEPVHDRPQGFRIGAVARFPADASIAYEARLLQHVQMFGDSRLRNRGAGSKGVNRLLALATQSLEQSASGGIGEGGEKAIRLNVHE